MENQAKFLLNQEHGLHHFPSHHGLDHLMREAGVTPSKNETMKEAGVTPSKNETMKEAGVTPSKNETSGSVKDSESFYSCSSDPERKKSPPDCFKSCSGSGSNLEPSPGCSWQEPPPSTTNSDPTVTPGPRSSQLGDWLPRSNVKSSTNMLTLVNPVIQPGRTEPPSSTWQKSVPHPSGISSLDGLSLGFPAGKGQASWFNVQRSTSSQNNLPSQGPDLSTVPSDNQAHKTSPSEKENYENAQVPEKTSSVKTLPNCDMNVCDNETTSDSLQKSGSVSEGPNYIAGSASSQPIAIKYGDNQSCSEMDISTSWSMSDNEPELRSHLDKVSSEQSMDVSGNVPERDSISPLEEENLVSEEPKIIHCSPVSKEPNKEEAPMSVCGADSSPDGPEVIALRSAPILPSQETRFTTG